MILLLSYAFAVDTIPEPAVDAQQFRLPVDASYSLWADDATLHKGFLARIGAGYTRDPVVWKWDDTGEKVTVVGDAIGLDVVAAYTFWRIRLGVDVPVYVMTSGEAGSGAGLGDIAVDAKIVALDPESAPVGLAADVRVRAPTTTTEVPLGVDGVSWEAAAVVSKRAGIVALAGNVGVRGAPGDVDLSTWLTLRASLGLVFTDHVGMSLDAAGALALNDGGTTPGELMLGGWVRPADPIALRLGVGRGITAGAGSPAARAVFAVDIEPGLGKPAAPKVKPVVANPAVVAVPDQLAVITVDHIVLTKKVAFEDATISGGSFEVLDAVAALLRTHPEIKSVRIESHTDDRLDVEVTLPQSGMRATAVLNYLVSRGVAADRLIAAGYAGTRPLVPGSTPEAWAANDRIEFVITGR